MKRRVVIVGGGLAGMAAALRVLDAGDQPVLVEGRPQLGGRATSFRDPRTGELLDNCQHVVMGCCTNLLDFYERIGVGHLIEWHPETYWANPPHEPDVMRPGPLPAPAHFSLSFARMRFLDLRSKRAIARAMLRMIRIGRAGRAGWTDRTFLEFLEETGQTPEAIDRFWRVVVVSACNLDLDEVGASFALQVFQEGFLAHRFASSMGLARVALSELYDPFEEHLRAHGGELQLSTNALAISWDGRRVTGVVAKEGVLEGAAVISAVPFERLARLCSDSLVAADPRLQKLDRMETSPILGVHLFFDTTVMELPHLVLPGRDTHWFFNKGVDEQGRQHLHAVISAATDWMALDQSEILERVMRDLVWALPAARGLEPIGHRAIKEKRATFRAAAGVDRIRPPVRPGLGVENLLLAGDWCDTGWPATMEGAVRSGYLAGAEASGGVAGVPDLPVSAGGRLLGL